MMFMKIIVINMTPVDESLRNFMEITKLYMSIINA